MMRFDQSNHANDPSEIGNTHHLVDMAQNQKQPTNPQHSSVDDELREKIRRAQSDLEGRKYTHMKVANLSHWSYQELEGVHKGDQIIFENDILALIEAERVKAQEQLLDELESLGERHYSTWGNGEKVLPLGSLGKWSKTKRKELQGEK